MDLFAKLSISLITPILFHIAKDDYQYLVGILVLANPFTITLLISTLNYLSTANSSNNNNNNTGATKSNSITKQNKSSKDTCRRLNSNVKLTNNEDDDNKQSNFICCSYAEDKIFIYYKCWLIFTHLTFIFNFQFYVIPSLTIAFGELFILYTCYVILLILILNLKFHINEATSRLKITNFNSNVTSPLTRTQDINQDENLNLQQESLQFRDNNISCDQLCYLKMLAFPIFSRDTNMDWINGNDTRSTERNRENSLSNKLEIFSDFAHEDNETNFSRSTNNNNKWISNLMLRKYIKFNLSSSCLPTNNNYLSTCNALHVLILLQLFYLNITFTCASNTSRLFGKYLLIPSECSNIYDNVDARAAMFTAVYSAQLLLCQLAFMFRLFT